MSRSAGRCTVEVVDINASAGRVWTVLSDVESWPTWTPTMTSVQGRGGSRLALGADFDIRQPGLRPSVMRVTELSDGASFTWASSSRGMNATAEHVVSAVGDEVSRVELTFDIAGPMAPVVWLLFGRKIREFVSLEAASLKKACEQ